MRTGVTERDLYPILVLIDRHNTAAHGEFKYISFPRAVFFIYNEIYWNLFAKSGKIEDYLIYRREQNSVGCSAEKGKSDGCECKGAYLKRTEYRRER